jgi:hypothetical protein
MYAEQPCDVCPRWGECPYLGLGASDLTDAELKGSCALRACLRAVLGELTVVPPSKPLGVRRSPQVRTRADLDRLGRAVHPRSG